MPNKVKPQSPKAPKGPPGVVNHILAANLRKLINHRGISASAVAGNSDAMKKQIQRALKASHSPTLDTVAALAAEFGLQPWQILIPNLDPSNPPVFTMTRTEMDTYAKVKRYLESLPTPG